MKIAVRLDDITQDMDWGNFHRMERLLDTYHIAPLLGIVPENQDNHLKRNEPVENFEDCIKAWNEKGWSFALHGWHHIYTTNRGGLFPLNRFSEFAGVPREKQSEMLEEGRERLKKMGITTDIFMAPAHSYDKNTLIALQKAGFAYVTDGFGSMPYEWKGLTFLPIAFLKNRDIEKEKGYTTLVFHTNTMTEQDFADLERLLEKHKDDFVSYREYVRVPAQRQSLVGRMKEYSMAVWKRLLVKGYTLKKG